LPDTSPNDPLAVKDVALQMNFGAPQAPAPTELPVLHFSAEPSLSPVSETISN
jgi:hypothetical protein